MSAQIAINKKAKFDYFIEEEVESGIALEGWKSKALEKEKPSLWIAMCLLKTVKLFYSAV